MTNAAVICFTYNVTLIKFSLHVGYCDYRLFLPVIVRLSQTKQKCSKRAQSSSLFCLGVPAPWKSWAERATAVGWESPGCSHSACCPPFPSTIHSARSQALCSGPVRHRLRTAALHCRDLFSRKEPQLRTYK